jgi:hypothetical protein
VGPPCMACGGCDASSIQLCLLPAAAPAAGGCAPPRSPPLWCGLLGMAAETEEADTEAGGTGAFEQSNPLSKAVVDDNRGEAGKGVQMVHLPLDVDSLSYSVSDLKDSIEAGWIDKLKRYFEQKYGDDFMRLAEQGQNAGSDYEEGEEERDASWQEAWDLVWEGSLEEIKATCPYAAAGR